MEKAINRTQPFWQACLLAGGGLTSLATAAPAYAQSEPPVSDPEAARSSAAQAVDPQGVIIVTARRRSEDIQDVPISMTDLSAEELSQGGIGDFRELDGVVPNMVQTGLDSNVTPSISIRGIGSDARNIGFESGVSVYVDGVYAGRPTAWMSELVDVDRIDVLRGPQGSLFGKNTIAGAVSVNIRRPGPEFRATAELEAGSFDLLRARGSISGPIAETLFAGLSLFTTRRDGFQTNLFNNLDYGNKRDWGGRGQVVFAPTHNFNILVEGDILREHLRMNLNTTVSGLGSTAAQGPRFVNINEPAYTDREISGWNANANLTLGNGGTLTSITAQRFNNIELLSDDDGSPVGILRSNFRDEETQFTQEVRYTSPSNQRFRYVLGLFYLDQHVVTDRISTAPAGGLAPVTLNVTLTAEVNAHDYAAFGQGDFDITDALTLTLGARYTHIDKTVFANLRGLPAFNIISFSNHREEQSADAVSPTASLVYEISDAVNIYGTFSRGFKGGGFNADFVSNPNLSFAPEYVNNYEVGLKVDALGHRLRADLALFHMDYSNLQVSVVSPIGGFIIDNAASATINGAELDFAARPARGLTLNLGVGYTDASFDEFGANTGNRLAFAPRWTLSTAAQYEVPLSGTASLTFRGEYNYRSDYYADVNNAPNRLVQGYGLLNARITLAAFSNRVQLQVWGENLTNKLYITDRGAPLGGLLGSQSVVYGRPRMYGVRLIGTF